MVLLGQRRRVPRPEGGGRLREDGHGARPEGAHGQPGREVGRRSGEADTEAGGEEFPARTPGVQFNRHLIFVPEPVPSHV